MEARAITNFYEVWATPDEIKKTLNADSYNIQRGPHANYTYKTGRAKYICYFFDGAKDLIQKHDAISVTDKYTKEEFFMVLRLSHHDMLARKLKSQRIYKNQPPPNRGYTIQTPTSIE